MVKKQTKAAEAGKPTATVIKEFRDRNNFDLVHEVGSDVSDFDPELLESLRVRGHVELSDDASSDTEPNKDNQ